jgi:hypothetical protein
LGPPFGQPDAFVQIGQPRHHHAVVLARSDLTGQAADLSLPA